MSSLIAADLRQFTSSSRGWMKLGSKTKYKTTFAIRFVGTRGTEIRYPNQLEYDTERSGSFPTFVESYTMAPSSRQGSRVHSSPNRTPISTPQASTDRIGNLQVSAGDPKILTAISATEDVPIPPVVHGSVHEVPVQVAMKPDVYLVFLQPLGSLPPSTSCPDAIPCSAH